jgi:hypothetical protein
MIAMLAVDEEDDDDFRKDALAPVPSEVVSYGEDEAVCSLACVRA